MNSMVVLIIVLFSVICIKAETKASTAKCKVPIMAPRNIAKVINQCQDEIKNALLSEAAQLLKEDNSDYANSRRKREAFSNDERRIAGCLLQCVYRKMKAEKTMSVWPKEVDLQREAAKVSISGFPTIEGLVALYTEGVADRDYILATYQAVHSCLTAAQKKHITTPQSLSENGKTCDIAFDVFDCVSDRIGEYCGQTP